MIKKILVPTDFSACADQALQYALGLARTLGAEVQIVHCATTPDYQIPNLVSPAMSAAAANMVEQLRRLYEAAQQEMAELVARNQDKGVAISGLNVDGPPDEGIVRQATSWGADVIIIGSHGRRGVSRVLLGSVAERVVRHAPCPVLVVHPPKK